MSAFEREKVFVELRKYHVDAFPDKLASTPLNKLRADFLILEDEAVTMLLSLVNGKQAFVDLSPGLKKMKNKLKPSPGGNKKEEADKKFFLSKINKLMEILEMAGAVGFQVRPPRRTRAAS